MAESWVTGAANITAGKGDFYKEARASQDWTETARRIIERGMTKPGSYWLAPEYATIQREIDEMMPVLQEIYDREGAMAKNRKAMDRIRAEMESLETIKGSFAGGGIDEINRWLIDNNITKLQHEASRINAKQDRLISETETIREKIKSWDIAGLGGGWQGWGFEEKERGVGKYEAPTKLPIPDWMQQYLEPSISGLEERPEGTEGEEIPWAERQAYAIRPLGAQAEVSTPELEMLFGRLGWGKAGAPMYFGEEYVEALKNLPGWIGEETEKWTSLFPSAERKAKPTWRTATQ